MDLIIIDPGHGGEDPGAVNIDTGLEEKNINLTVAKKLWGMLSSPSCGDLIRLTRTTDISVPLADRAGYANHLKECFPESSACFVSIHCNSFPDSSVRGVEVFHFPGSKEGERLAGFTIEAMSRGFPGLPLRGIKANPNFLVLRDTIMPAVLIEMEFISNPEAVLILADEKCQMKMAQSIAEGIRNRREARG